MSDHQALAQAELGATSTGWRPERELSFGEWRQVGQRFAQVGRALPWLLGDWVNFGEAAYGEKYTEAIEITGLEPGTLMDMAWVASQFEASRRHEGLSWSHHREVAGLEPAAADQLLALAALGEWPRNRLRTEVRSLRTPSETGEGGSADSVTGVALPSSQPTARMSLSFELAEPGASGEDASRGLAERLDLLRERAAELGLRVVVEA